MSDESTEIPELSSLKNDELTLLIDFIMLDKDEQEEILKHFKRIAKENEKK